jgi:ribosomal 30S subunit maturation factor RimM
MEISDLVVIGRLGRLEPDGFFSIQFSQSHQSVLAAIKDCYLIFTSNRVFFVTVEETKTVGRRNFIRFKEDGVSEEADKHPNAEIALPGNELSEASESVDELSVNGYKVVFGNEIIGEIDGVMLNPMQSVLIISLVQGGELLVPNVENFVQEIDSTDQSITLHNIEGLLELCTSMS